MSGLSILFLAAAQTAQAPAQPEEPRQPCATQLPKDGDREIVICVEKPDGYRIDPDLMEAERAKKADRKLKRPERMVDRSCASVGPMGCRDGAGINLMAAALTAAEMARRAATGGNVGEMFITEPQPSEYERYQAAKREREARQAEARALSSAAQQDAERANSTEAPPQ